LSAKTLDALGPVGGEVLVLTELQVREDAWTLFGFGSAHERDSFRALTSIQGVGGRLALAILSTLSPDELARAVAQDDKAMIGRANGVGPKLAARIANELSSLAIRAASLGPTPLARPIIALSSCATARASSSGERVERMANASRPPTPWIDVNARNESRSWAEPKPNKVQASSRT